MTQQTAGETPEIVMTEETPTLVVREMVRMDRLPEFYDRAFGAITEQLEKQALTPTTAAYGRYFSEPAEEMDVEAGIGVDRVAAPEGSVAVGALPSVRAARMHHRGGYDGLGQAWQRLYEWIQEQGEQQDSWMWEEYVTPPGPDTGDDELLPVLTWPLRQA